MKHFIWILALFVILVIQGGVFLPMNLEMINLPLLIIVISLLFSDFNFALFLAFVGGVMLDFLSGSNGIVLAALVSSFLIMYFVINNILDREPTLPILFSAVAAGTVGYFLVFLAVNQILGWLGNPLTLNVKSLFFFQLPKALVLNLVFTYPVFQFYSFVEYLNQRFAKNEPKSI